MLFRVHDQLFSQPGESLLLTTLMGLCLLREHRLTCDTTTSGHRAWMADRSEKERLAIETLIDISDLDQVDEPAEREVEVGTDQSDWEQSPPARHKPPRVSLRSAIRLASRSFGFMLEGNTNDLAFLLCCAPPQSRARIESMRQGGLLDILNGGGLGSMKPAVEEFSPEDTLNRWVMFDSDALFVNGPSRQSEELREACLRKNLPHHQLRRRAIENYLPESAIEEWASRGKTWEEKRIRAGKTREWKQLTGEQRWHLNVKKGFEGDRARFVRLKAKDQQRFQDFWASTPESKPALASGFDESIADLFAEGALARIDRSSLAQHGVLEEMDSVVEQLMRLLR